jgi:hypothetical protein
MIGIIIAWLTAVLSNLKKLTSTEQIELLNFKVRDRAFNLVLRERVIGYTLIILSTAGLLVAVVDYLWTQSELQKVRKVNTILNGTAFNEASGGSAIGGLAYILDDEKPIIFKFEHDKDNDKYNFLKEIPIKQKLPKVIPNQGCQAGADVNKDCAAIPYRGCEEKDIVDKDCVEDLEAAAGQLSAALTKRLYLITSHSNRRNGRIEENRQRLLEVSLEDATEGEITNVQVNLRRPIIQQLEKIAKQEQDGELERTLTDMQSEAASRQKRIDGIQIEGLAIDAANNAYIGFRKPLVKKGGALHAIVLRAALPALFTNNPTFEAYLLYLPARNSSAAATAADYYGISSIDYDARSQYMLILGNHPEGKYLTPILCRWDVSKAEVGVIQTPPCKEVSFNNSHPDVSIPELLLLPPRSQSDKIFMFLDTDEKALGEVVDYERRDFGLVDR